MSEWTLAKIDSSEKVVLLVKRKVFVVLIGGPGLYNGDDPAHDKAWYSYVDPVLQAAKLGILAEPTEEVHWCVYSPAYMARWTHDRQKPNLIQRHIVDSDLSVTRYEHTTKVTSNGSKNYLDHINKKADDYNRSNPFKVKVIGVSSAAEFWQHLAMLSPNSLSRVYYFGHASYDLWLTLYHDADDMAVMLPSKASIETIQRRDISRHAFIKDRFVANARPSKFFGCNTAPFAQLWAHTYGAPAEGAEGKVDFQARGFSGIEASATVGWRSYS